MRLLGKQLKVDFLPRCAVDINVVVAKKFRRIRLSGRKIDEGFLIAKSGKLVNQQGTVDLKGGIERNKSGIRARQIAFRRRLLPTDETCEIDHTEKTATQIGNPGKPLLGIRNWLRRNPRENFAGLAQRKQIFLAASLYSEP